MKATAPREKMVGEIAVRLILDDITLLDMDAFVFYAEENLALGTGFGTAVAVRGGPTIQKELTTLAPAAKCDAVISGAGNLKAGHIIHAVGPKFQEPGTEEKLRRTVLNCLRKADEAGLRRIAFPAMGAGFYGIQLDACARVMLDAIGAHIGGTTGIREVVLCVLDRREFEPFEKALAAWNGKEDGR